MKRNCIRVGVLGILLLLGWLAATYSPRTGIEAKAANPLRRQPAMAEDRVMPASADSPVSEADTIPDAAALDLSTPEDQEQGLPGSREEESLAPINAVDHRENSMTGSAAAMDGPELSARYAPADTRSAPKTVAIAAGSRPNELRAPASRTNHETEEPARFQADLFDDSTALPSARNDNPPPAKMNPSHAQTLRTSADAPVDDPGTLYPAPSGNAQPLLNADFPSNSDVAPGQINPSDQGDPIGSSGQGNIANDGTGQPGAKQLEGPQSPQVTIQKVAPPEIQVGRPAIFKTIVRNTGSIPANQIEVRDMIPKGTRLLSTAPRAQQGTRGEIIWTLGTLRPGEESAVEMELMPTAEGEIGSVATVHFGADASAKTICTRPDIVVQTVAPAQALIGEKFHLQITVTNPGSGVATGIVLEEHLPAGLQHPAGSELEYNIGALRPGESKKLDLEVVAAAAGQVTNLLSVRADGNLRREDRLQLEVIAPKLDIALDGPKKRYLEREAVYQLSVTNPGTAPAQGVELAAYLPSGMKFVSANNQGHYDEASRAVYWRLEQLPTQETGTVEMVTLPVEAGQHSIKLRGAAQKVQAVEKEQPVVIEGIAAVMFQVGDSVDPIEVGGETTYEVRVVNQGTKPASNVQLMAVLSPEMQPLSADGPTRYAVQGNNVVFEGLARLAPKSETIYHVRVKGARAGDSVVKFQLKTDEIQRWVTKEESTQVYADE